MENWNWTEEQIIYLQENYFKLGVKCIEHIGCNEYQLYHKVAQLGLRLRAIYNRDLSGKRFGNLTPVSLVDKSLSKQLKWNCVCDCGTELSVLQCSLLSGSTKSCGCFHRKQLSDKLYKGGKYITGSEFCALKRRAKDRKLELNITIDYLEQLYEKQNKLCALSGVPITFNTTIVGGGGKIINGNASVDRIDSNHGYIIGNIQLLDKSVNVAKMAMSQTDFLEMCKKITLYSSNSDSIIGL